MAYRGVILKAYPTATQRQKIEQTFGCCRLVYNKRLADRKESGDSKPRSTNFPDISSEYLKDFPFLESIDGKALVCSLQDQEKAVKRLGSTTDLSSLRFKSKRDHWQSYRTWGVSLNRERTRIDLPIVGSIKVKGFFGSYSRIVSASIKRTPPGEYYIVLTLEFKPEPRPNKGGQIGIDVGLDLYSVDSNGHENNNPQYYEKSLKKLKRLQRRLDRKTKDSKNYEKQRRRLAKVHAKIANQRKDYLQKLTTTLIRENQTICVEELDIRAMLADKSASQHIASASWRMFRDILTYKAAWYGNELKLANPSLISRSICPHCGYMSSGNTDRLTSMRMCPNCKKFFDADQRVASKILLNAH